MVMTLEVELLTGIQLLFSCVVLAIFFTAEPPECSDIIGLSWQTVPNQLNCEAYFILN